MEYTIIYVLLVSLTVYAMNYVVYYIILCPLGWSVTYLLFLLFNFTEREVKLLNGINEIDEMKQWNASEVKLLLAARNEIHKRREQRE